MIERAIMLFTLTELKRSQGIAYSEKNLHVSMNLSATRTITALEMVEHLQEAYDKGWVNYRMGIMRDKQWYITPLGLGALAELEAGG